MTGLCIKISGRKQITRKTAAAGEKKTVFIVAKSTDLDITYTDRRKHCRIRYFAPFKRLRPVITTSLNLRCTRHKPRAVQFLLVLCFFRKVIKSLNDLRHHVRIEITLQSLKTFSLGQHSLSTLATILSASTVVLHTSVLSIVRSITTGEHLGPGNFKAFW